MNRTPGPERLPSSPVHLSTSSHFQNNKAPDQRGLLHFGLPKRLCAQAAFFFAMTGATALAVAATVLSVISATCLPALLIAS